MTDRPIATRTLNLLVETGKVNGLVARFDSATQTALLPFGEGETSKTTARLDSELRVRYDNEEFARVGNRELKAAAAAKNSDFPSPYKASAKLLRETFHIADPETAMANMVSFHRNALTAVKSERSKPSLSGEKIHQFYSLVTHMLEAGGAHNDAESVKELLTTLKLGKPLSLEALAPHIQTIVNTSSPAQEEAKRR